MVKDEVPVVSVSFRLSCTLILMCIGLLWYYGMVTSVCHIAFS